MKKTIPIPIIARKTGTRKFSLINLKN